MKLSVLIPTHNRRDSLVRALNSLVAMTRPEGCSIDVVVVASDCADDTVEAAQAFSDLLPLRILVEPAPGASRARNRALEVIDGDAIVFLDDDATAAPDLACVYAAALVQYPEYGCFAGAITSRLEGDPSPLMREVARVLPTTFGNLWLGPSPRRMDPKVESPFAGNMVIRTQVLGERRFDETLGRRGHGNLEGGDETNLFEELTRAGMSTLWLPDAHAEHWINPERQNMNFVSTYWFQVGVSQARLGHERPRQGFSGYWRGLRKAYGYWRRRLTRRPHSWLLALRDLKLHEGRMAALRQYGASLHRPR